MSVVTVGSCDLSNGGQGAGAQSYLSKGDDYQMGGRLTAANPGNLLAMSPPKMPLKYYILLFHSSL